MISKERKASDDQLRDLIGNDASWRGVLLSDIACELLELRKAFSEPVCIVDDRTIEKLNCGFSAICFAPVGNVAGDIFLYRKPLTYGENQYED